MVTYTRRPGILLLATNFFTARCEHEANTVMITNRRLPRYTDKKIRNIFPRPVRHLIDQMTFRRLWYILGFPGFQTALAGHGSFSDEEELSTPLNMSAFSHLPSYDVTFLPKDDILILDLDQTPSITRTPRITLSPAELIPFLLPISTMEQI